jgi:hypothetical protein
MVREVTVGGGIKYTPLVDLDDWAQPSVGAASAPPPPPQQQALQPPYVWMGGSGGAAQHGAEDRSGAIRIKQEQLYLTQQQVKLSRLHAFLGGGPPAGGPSTHIESTHLGSHEAAGGAGAGGKFRPWRRAVATEGVAAFRQGEMEGEMAFRQGEMAFRQGEMVPLQRMATHSMAMPAAPPPPPLTPAPLLPQTSMLAAPPPRRAAPPPPVPLQPQPANALYAQQGALPPPVPPPPVAPPPVAPPPVPARFRTEVLTMLRQRQAPLEVTRLLPEHCLFFRRPRPLEPHELGCEGFTGPRGVLAMVRTMADCLAFLPDPRGGELCSLVLRENGGSSLAPPPPPLPAPAPPPKALAPPPSLKVASRVPPPPPHAASRQVPLPPRPPDQSADKGDDKGGDHRTWLQPNKHPTSALVEFLQSMHGNAGLSAASEWSPTYEMHPVPPVAGGEGHIRCVARAGGQVATAEAADKKMAKFGASQVRDL